METRNKKRGGDSAQGRKRLKTTRNSGDELMTDINPFLNHLVLETIFSYAQLIDPNFKDYRLVCKMWDNEVQKITRSFTQINLERILSPYPDGLGWTDGSRKKRLAYQAPHHRFENVEVTGTCENLVDPQLRRWFEVEGDNVKKLRFTSALTCYHHVRFLECILKQWCPNLTSLALAGVYSSPSLLFSSHFVDPRDPICVNLKQLIIAVNQETMYNKLFSDCGKDLPSSFLNFGGLNLRAAGWYMEDMETLPNIFIQSVTDAIPRLKDLYFDQVDDEVQDTLPPIGDLHKVQPYIQQYTYDGGVVGQLLTSLATVDNLQFRLHKRLEFPGLVTLLHCQPNRLKQTLTSFHLNDPSMLDRDHGKFLRVFGMQGFPLRELRISVSCITDVELLCFLGFFSETLEHLEVASSFVDKKSTDLSVPVLSKLKYFEHENVDKFQYTGFPFLRDYMPSLERCKLRQANNETFTYEAFLASYNLFENEPVQAEFHPLEEISINLLIFEETHVKMMADWFPFLRKVELVLKGGKVFCQFFRTSAIRLALEDVKILFMTSKKESSSGIVDSLGKHSSLKFLQLEHLPKAYPVILSEQALRKGFGQNQVPELTSLKLTNFSIRAKLDRIHCHLAHISCVEFSKVTFLIQTDNTNRMKGETRTSSSAWDSPIVNC